MWYISKCPEILNTLRISGHFEMTYVHMYHMQNVMIVSRLWFHIFMPPLQLLVTVLAKTRHVRTKTEFNFIAAVYRHTQYLSIPSVSSAKC